MGSKKEQFTYISNTKTLQRVCSAGRKISYTSALSLSSWWCLYTGYFCVLCPLWAIHCTSRIRHGLCPDSFLFTVREQRVWKRKGRGSGWYIQWDMLITSLILLQLSQSLYTNLLRGDVRPPLALATGHVEKPFSWLFTSTYRSCIYQG